MTKRRCVVPICKNNSSTHPNKIYLRVPSDKERQKLWARALNLPAIRRCGSEYVCEDHFNLSEDCSNWMQYKVMGQRLILKPKVIPHQFLTKKCPESKSQLTDSEKNRKRCFLENFQSTSQTEEMGLSKAGIEETSVGKRNKIDSPAVNLSEVSSVATENPQLPLFQKNLFYDESFFTPSKCNITYRNQDLSPSGIFVATHTAVTVSTQANIRPLRCSVMVNTIKTRTKAVGVMVRM